MAAQGRIPTRAELEAFSLGQLDSQREWEVEVYLAEHPECWPDLEATPDDEVVRHLRGAGNLPRPRARSPLLQLAIEAVIPALAGAAGALAGGVEGGVLGAVVGKVAEKAINVFGQHIVSRWLEWLRKQPPGLQVAALTQLSEVLPEVARSEASAVLAQQQVSQEVRQLAIDYLSAIPRSVRRSLLSDRERGGKTLPPRATLDDSLSLLQLLPVAVPPYPTPGDLPGTSYRLEEMIGSGGFGAVYRASLTSEQHLSRAIKFCLDWSLSPALRQERDNLERLMQAGGASWSPRLVRLYGYDLEHQTPYLVYEYVSGGDLVRWLATRQVLDGRDLTPAEVLVLIIQVAEALAFAHERGLVHRDLKPANVLMAADGTIKLADFGIGGLVARQALQGSLIGTVAASRLSPAEQASLFRGAGTPLYMSPEQRRGEGPDPRHDIYSLGVMWYQLLAGNVTREMSHGWARELEARFATPRQHRELIERCVGWIQDRPRDAGELLALLRRLPAAHDGARKESAESPPLSPPPPPPALVPRVSDRIRYAGLVARLKKLLACHQAVLRHQPLFLAISPVSFIGLVLGLVVGTVVGCWVFTKLAAQGRDRGSEELRDQQKRSREPGERKDEKPARWEEWDREKQRRWIMEQEELRLQQQQREKEESEKDKEEASRQMNRAENIGLISGFGTAAGVLALAISFAVWLRRKALTRAKQALAARIDELVAEFPQEVSSLGGPSALRDRVIVRELLRELEAQR
jgi:serine/threonine protein kinase